MFNLSTCFCERVSPHWHPVLTSMLLKNLLQQFQINTTQLKRLSHFTVSSHRYTMFSVKGQYVSLLICIYITLEIFQDERMVLSAITAIQYFISVTFLARSFFPKSSVCGVELRSQYFKVIQYVKFLETHGFNALYLYTMLLLLSNYQTLLKDYSLSATYTFPLNTGDRELGILMPTCLLEQCKMLQNILKGLHILSHRKKSLS